MNKIIDKELIKYIVTFVKGEFYTSQLTKDLENLDKGILRKIAKRIGTDLTKYLVNLTIRREDD